MEVESMSLHSVSAGCLITLSVGLLFAGGCSEDAGPEPPQPVSLERLWPYSQEARWPYTVDGFVYSAEFERYESIEECGGHTLGRAV